MEDIHAGRNAPKKSPSGRWKFRGSIEIPYLPRPMFWIMEMLRCFTVPTATELRVD
jgi:hypothetical protein